MHVSSIPTSPNTSSMNAYCNHIYSFSNHKTLCFILPQPTQQYELPYLIHVTLTCIPSAVFWAASAGIIAAVVCAVDLPLKSMEMEAKKGTWRWIWRKTGLNPKDFFGPKSKLKMNVNKIASFRRLGKKPWNAWSRSVQESVQHSFTNICPGCKAHIHPPPPAPRFLHKFIGKCRKWQYASMFLFLFFSFFLG